MIDDIDEKYIEQRIDEMARAYAVTEYNYGVEDADTDVDVHCCIEDFKAGYRAAIQDVEFLNKIVKHMRDCSADFSFKGIKECAENNGIENSGDYFCAFYD